VSTVAADPTSGFPFDLILAAYGPAGPALADVANLLLVSSVFAALASFHTIVTRYLYAAGRDHVLPAALGRVDRHTCSPANASHLLSGTAVVVIGGFALVGGDPFAGLFAWGSYIAAVGVLALMIGSAVAVVGYFARHEHERPAVWVWAVAPILSAALMAGLWLLILTNSETMIGAPRFGSRHLTLLAFLAAGLIAGLARARVLRRDLWSWTTVAAATPAEASGRFPLERKQSRYATDQVYHL
jgi:amino acid transporter